ncbi:MAG: MCE family protein [Planctomycetes bacterium]|nr:MCE family protein [Planctomycetota bacterium]
MSKTENPEGSQPAQSPANPQYPEHPQANIIHKKRHLWPWIIPLLTAIFMFILLLQNSGSSGPHMTIHFDHGYGIKVGDTLRHRGIAVGEIDEVAVEQSGKSIRVGITLMAQAEFLTRSQSRFWIVRPRLNLTQISGADTIIGARYIAVSPGGGQEQFAFQGLKQEPAVIHRSPGGLEIICQAQQRHGLQSGAPVTYRQVIIGRVLSVNLASDASAVEVRVYIHEKYRALIRHSTVFWNASGFKVTAGLLAGLNLNVESLDALLHGGIAIAVAEKPSAMVANGHRFSLHGKSKDDWLKWDPSIDLQHTRVHSHDIPNIVEAQLAWTKNGMFSTSQHSHSAQVIAVNTGLIGPSELLCHDAIKTHNAQLIIDTHKQDLPQALWNKAGLAFIPLSLPRIPWNKDHLRIPIHTEDADAIVNEQQQIHISATRLSEDPKEKRWVLEHDGKIDQAWNGCPVLARSDKKLIGFLIIDKRKYYVVPISSELLALLN